MYAVGGDGTAGDVAAALAGTSVELGIVPCGTTNVLAREFGIPLVPRRAAEALEASNRVLPLRTWDANGRTAVLGAGVGWDARVMGRSSQDLKQRAGRLGVALVGLGEIARYEFPALTVTGTTGRGEAVELRGTSVLLATVKRWAGGNAGIPMADPGDDLIDVVVIESRWRLHLLAFWSLMTIPGGRPLALPGVRAVQLTRARVVSDDGRPVEVHVNGEAVTRTPLVMEPDGFVRMIVPLRGA